MSYLALALQALGAVFLLIAAIGVIRLPDVLQRMHSATKAGTLGTALLLLGVIMGGTIDDSGSAWLPIVFLLLTLPLGAQLLGRASYISKAELQGLHEDPLAEQLARPRDAGTVSSEEP